MRTSLVLFSGLMACSPLRPIDDETQGDDTSADRTPPSIGPGTSTDSGDTFDVGVADTFDPASLGNVASLSFRWEYGTDASGAPTAVSDGAGGSFAPLFGLWFGLTDDTYCTYFYQLNQTAASAPGVGAFADATGARAPLAAGPDTARIAFAVDPDGDPCEITGDFWGRDPLKESRLFEDGPFFVGLTPQLTGDAAQFVDDLLAADTDGSLPPRSQWARGIVRIPFPTASGDQDFDAIVVAFALTRSGAPTDALVARADMDAGGRMTPAYYVASSAVTISF